MKSGLITIKGLTFLIMLLTAAGKLYAQDCKKYYYMMNNAEIQMTLYDKKDAISGIQTWKITNVTKSANGYSSTATFSFTDSNGQEITKGNGNYKCEGGKLMADVHMFLPQEEMQKTSMGNAKLNNAYVEYPSVLSEGMQLPDAVFDIDVNTSSIPSTAHYEMKNRKVVGKEKVSSDAGSWDAYKISYDAEMKIKMIGIGIPMKMQTTEWFVTNFGIVKSETYKKGKKLGSTLLTKLKK
jgi:hypothetical protein